MRKKVSHFGRKMIKFDNFRKLKISSLDQNFKLKYTKKAIKVKNFPLSLGLLLLLTPRPVKKSVDSRMR